MQDWINQIGAAVILAAGVLFAIFYKKQSPEPSPTPTPIPVPPPPTPNPTPVPSGPSWSNFPAVASYMNDGTFLADVANHTKRRERFNDQMTDCHETTHFINSDIRNQQGNGVTIVGFYVGEDRSVFFDQPKMRKRDIAPFIPSSCRGSRYSTYVTGQSEWDDSSLYLFDEWVAYANGGLCGVDLVQKGKYRGQWTDGVCGLLEFSIYAAATTAAIEVHDPSYFDHTPSYLLFTTWHLKRCYGIYAQGSVMAQFKWDVQDKILQSLRTASDAEGLRDVLRRRHGGIWLT